MSKYRQLAIKINVYINIKKLPMFFNNLLLSSQMTQEALLGVNTLFGL